MVILVVFPDNPLLLGPIPVHSGCYTRNTICGLTQWITLALTHLIKIFGPGSTMEKNKTKCSFCFILSLSKQEFITDSPFALFCTPACWDTKNITWNSSYLWPEWHMVGEALPRRWSQPGPVWASISVTQINGWESTVVHGSRKFPTSDDSATFRRKWQRQCESETKVVGYFMTDSMFDRGSSNTLNWIFASKLMLTRMFWIHTYKRLLSLCISPYAWGAWVWVARAIGTHPLVSSLAIRGSPHLLSHSAQTMCCSHSLAVAREWIPLLWVLGPVCHVWNKGQHRWIKEQEEDTYVSHLILLTNISLKLEHDSEMKKTASLT